jgi:hypothetical protein
VFVDQAKLDSARKLLAVDSERATLDEALDAVIFAEEVIAGFRGLAAAGGLEYFDVRDRPRKKR